MFEIFMGTNWFPERSAVELANGGAVRLIEMVSQHLTAALETYLFTFEKT